MLYNIHQKSRVKFLVVKMLKIKLALRSAFDCTISPTYLSAGKKFRKVDRIKTKYV